MTPRTRKILASISFATSAVFGGLSYGKYNGMVGQESRQDDIKYQQVETEKEADQRARVWEVQSQMEENAKDVLIYGGASVLALGAGVFAATRKTRRTGRRGMD